MNKNCKIYGWPTIKKKDLDSSAREEITRGILRSAAQT